MHQLPLSYAYRIISILVFQISLKINTQDAIILLDLGIYLGTRKTLLAKRVILSFCHVTLQG